MKSERKTVSHMCQLTEVLGCYIIGVQTTQGGQMEEDVCRVVTQLAHWTWCVQGILHADALKLWQSNQICQILASQQILVQDSTFSKILNWYYLQQSIRKAFLLTPTICKTSDVFSKNCSLVFATSSCSGVEMQLAMWSQRKDIVSGNASCKNRLCGIFYSVWILSSV